MSNGWVKGYFCESCKALGYVEELTKLCHTCYRTLCLMEAEDNRERMYAAGMREWKSPTRWERLRYWWWRWTGRRGPSPLDHYPKPGNVFEKKLTIVARSYEGEPLEPCPVKGCEETVYENDGVEWCETHGNLCRD